MLERFTDGARDAVSLATELARRNGHDQVLPEHLLVALAQQNTGVAGETLRGFEPSPEVLSARLLAALGEGRCPSTIAPPRAQATERVLQLVLREALGLGHNYIGTEHLLLALVRPDSRMPNAGRCPAPGEARGAPSARDRPARQPVASPPPGPPFGDVVHQGRRAGEPGGAIGGLPLRRGPRLPCRARERAQGRRHRRQRPGSHRDRR